MRLPRNAKVFRGQLDAAPFAGVTFLLLLFVVLQSKLVFNPGIQIDLPEVAADLPGTASPSVVVAIDGSGQVYYESQAVVSLAHLRSQLKSLVQQSKRPLTLEIQADKSATWQVTAPLLSLAEEAGLRGALLVTRPRTEPILKAGIK